MAVTFAAELDAVYEPFHAWKEKLYLADLSTRMMEFDGSLPGSPKASRTLTVAFFEHQCQLLEYLEQVCKDLGIDTKQTIVVEGEILPRFDFGCIDYDTFHHQVLAMDVKLSQIPDFDAFAPGWVQGIGPPFTTRQVLSKLLVAFGLGDFAEVFWEVLEEGWKPLITGLAEAIEASDWPRVRRLLRKLLDVITSSKFFDKLAAKVGRTLAAKIVGKILARALPIVGWGLLIGSIIWAIAEEYF